MKRLHVHVAVPDLEQSMQRETHAPGVDHVGIQVDSRSELDELSTRLKTAGETTFDQEATSCCYAKSDKSWVNDPSGVRWETFYTFGDATTYGEDVEAPRAAALCCS